MFLEHSVASETIVENVHNSTLGPPVPRSQASHDWTARTVIRVAGVVDRKMKKEKKLNRKNEKKKYQSEDWYNLLEGVHF